MTEPVIVNVKYTGYSLRCEVLEILPGGWVLVRQLTDFEDSPDEGPVFKAAIEFCYADGDEPPPPPGSFAGHRHSRRFTHKHKLN